MTPPRAEWPERVLRAARALYWNHLSSQRRTFLPRSFEALDEETRERLCRTAAAILRAADEELR